MGKFNRRNSKGRNFEWQSDSRRRLFKKRDTLPFDIARNRFHAKVIRSACDVWQQATF
jgi:hypothetical protein